VNILFIIRSLNLGGAERQLVNVAVGLKNRGHQVSVVIFYPGGPLYEELDAANVPVFVLDKKGRWDIFSFYFSLGRVVKSVKPDIIHGYTGVPNMLTLFSKPFHSPAKVVWGVRASFLDLSKYDWLARVLYKFECFLSRFPDLIISNSQSGAEHAQSNGFPGSKMGVVYNGINIQNFKPDECERLRIRHLFNIAEDAVLVGCVGRMDYMKGHPVFIDAMTQLVVNHDNVYACSIGNGEKSYVESLKKKVMNSGLADRFFWETAQSNIASYMNAFDLLVSPSFGEGFPNVIAEAMACGVPCVVTDVGDSAFLVGECGMVVPPHDSVALAQALDEMLRQLSQHQNNFTRCARERIVENFTIDKLVDNTEASLSVIIAKS
jgi:glycosyltransferase involved in cell wall biosynthesis